MLVIGTGVNDDEEPTTGRDGCAKAIKGVDRYTNVWLQSVGLVIGHQPHMSLVLADRRLGVGMS